MTRTHVILGCITVLVSGCFKVGPEFTRPDVRASPTWLDANDPRVKAEAADYRNWWQTFNDPVLNGLIERARRENLSLRSAGVRVLQARAQLGIAAGELYPQTQQAVGSLQYNRLSGSSPQAAFIPNPEYWQSQIGGQAGPGFQWNLFNYGQITNNVRVQDARFQQLLLTYQEMVLSAQQDVQDSLAAFLRAQDRADLLAQSVTSAKTALDLAVSQYQEGLKDFTTVLTAQQILLGQQDSLATGLGDISSSLVGTYRALGGGWEIREGQDLVPPEIRARMEKRTNWGGLLAPCVYNLPASREPTSAPRLPDG